jgi:hemerythrin
MDAYNTTAAPEADPGHMDSEHHVQLALVQALCEAIATNKPPRDTKELLDQLNAYTDLHFMSEQLLMRLYDYPDYGAHLQDHETFIGRLKAVQQACANADAPLALTTARELKTSLARHIQGRDLALARYLEQARCDPARL